MTRFSVRKGFFGAAGSPLVENGRVIANIGGRDGDKPAGIVAFNAETGAVMWTATNHEASYSSPVGATLGGKRTAVFLTRNGLVGLDPSSGSIFFQRMWRSRSSSSVNAATPLIVGDVIFVSATYETGAAAMRLQGNELKDLWSSDEVLSNHYATSVHLNGFLYGFHGRQEYNPSFRAVELATGAVKWSVDRFHAGTVTLAGNVVNHGTIIETSTGGGWADLELNGFTLVSDGSFLVQPGAGGNRYVEGSGTFTNSGTMHVDKDLQSTGGTAVVNTASLILTAPWTIPASFTSSAATGWMNSCRARCCGRRSRSATSGPAARGPVASA